MMFLPKFFTSAPTHNLDPISLSLIGGQAMMTAFQALSLVTRTHGSLQCPTAHNHSRNS